MHRHKQLFMVLYCMLLIVLSILGKREFLRMFGCIDTKYIYGPALYIISILGSSYECCGCIAISWS